MIFNKYQNSFEKSYLKMVTTVSIFLDPLAGPRVVLQLNSRNGDIHLQNQIPAISFWYSGYVVRTKLAGVM